MTASCYKQEAVIDPSLIPLPQKVIYKAGWYYEEGISDYCSRAKIIIDSNLVNKLGREGYILDVNSNSIIIESSSIQGAFYAKQTVKQLTDENGVRFTHIVDKPQFRYRGFHLDVSRNFFTKDEIFKILDEMSSYKMNCFHLHLTDNGGWRLQIDKYPLLTEKGSYRTKKDWLEWFKTDRHFCCSDTPGAVGGFYTKDDISEIVKYASDRFINIIPEIDVPAHSDAVFAGYPELNCTKSVSGNGEFCIANHGTVEFIKGVLDEVMELFPSRVIHIGGDEARKEEWKKCPKCNAMMKEYGMKSYGELQIHLLRVIYKYLSDHGRIMAGWDQILSDSELPNDVIIYNYRNQKFGIDAANQQNKTVLTPEGIFYLDWWQADLDLEPIAMGSYSPLYKLYAYNPLPVTLEDFERNEVLFTSNKTKNGSLVTLKPENISNIIGVQGCLWTEYVDNYSHLEYMIFPRLLAIAEKGWSGYTGSYGWEDFTRRIGNHVNQFHARGVNAYDLHDGPWITAKATESHASTVTMLCEQYKGEIRYSIGNEELNASSNLYKKPIHIDEDLTINTGVFKNGKLISNVRTIKVNAGEDTNIEYPIRWPNVN